jgi:hypothetical protein
MANALKRTALVLLGILVLAVAGFQVMKSRTKKASPEETAIFRSGDLEVTVTYSRPFKKGRQIFGALVPYGKVWRTGANEATTITFNSDVVFGTTPVKAGTYTLWSQPGPDEWTVMLNGKMYGWGVDFDGNAQRDPLADVAQAKVPVQRTQAPVEQFTIAVEGNPPALTLSWDDQQVAVPLGE